MANPTSRHSKARRDRRRANWKGALPTIQTCPECNEPKETHRVCAACGTYNNRKVLQIVEKEA